MSLTSASKSINAHRIPIPAGAEATTQRAKRQEAVIGGFTDPKSKGGREGFGALLLGIYEGRTLQYVGRVGIGFSDSMLRNIRRLLNDIAIDKSPFSDLDKLAGAHWVRPKYVAEVRLAEWTRDSTMRHPVFLGLKADTKPTQVMRER